MVLYSVNAFKINILVTHTLKDGDGANGDFLRLSSLMEQTNTIKTPRNSAFLFERDLIDLINLIAEELPEDESPEREIE
jgi:hypothetical protein